MTPNELAKDPSKIAGYLEDKIRLVEQASKRLEDVLTRTNVLFGHVPDHISEEICLSFLGWEGADDIFRKASDIIHRRRTKRLEREGKIDDPSAWELKGEEKEQNEKYHNAYFRFLELCNNYSKRVWESNILFPSIKTGLVARLRREKKLVWLVDDLELDCLGKKFGVKRDESELPRKENEGHQERMERWREWHRQNDAKFRMELSSKITGPSHQVRSRWCQTTGNRVSVHYQWKLEHEGKTHIVRLEIPSDDRKVAKIRLKTRGKNEWIVGRMFFFGGNPREWKQTPKGPQISLVTARQMPKTGIFRIYDFQNDKVLEPV